MTHQAGRNGPNTETGCSLILGYDTAMRVGELTGLKIGDLHLDAGSPYQKGKNEVNHELIRRILPKETNLNKLKSNINLMNLKNSYKRKKLNNRSPYVKTALLKKQ